VEKMSGSVTTEGISRRERERLISSSSLLSSPLPDRTSRTERARRELDRFAGTWIARILYVS
jgi:hypothetical protein